MSRLPLPHPVGFCSNHGGFGLIGGRRDGILWGPVGSCGCQKCCQFLAWRPMVAAGAWRPSVGARSRCRVRLTGRGAHWQVRQASAASVNLCGVISFEQLIAAGGKDGARETFERLIAQLVRLQYRTVRKVEPNPGDWGLDVIVGELDGVVSVWQSKFFIDGVDKAQQAQIRESFGQVVKQAEERGFTVGVWTLCIPVDLDAASLQWWTGWKARKSRETGVRIQLWDRTELEGLLLAPDAVDLRAAYFPASTGAGPSATGPLPVRELPDDVAYDDMLFIKQLEAARIFEHESAKQQFFNAEVLSREVADKRVAEHLGALEAERADVLSMWEDRYNRACGETEDGDGLLPTLHPAVMNAIEQRHNGRGVEVLPMYLVHRKGAMHQVVEGGRAGWVRNFRSVAEAHGGT